MCRSVPQIAVFSTSISTSLWPYSGTGTSAIQMPLAASRLTSALIMFGMSVPCSVEIAIIRRALKSVPVQRAPTIGRMPGNAHAIDARPPAIFLMGPTASGKTALACALADHFPVELVSVDSALVYCGLDIGAAKPDADTLRNYPHALIDIRDPAEPYSAAQFRDDALATMQATTARGRVPLLVGGTGLYFRALQRGLSDLPEADPALRARLGEEAARIGWPAMHARLAQLDPAAAVRIGPNDAQRLQRALEVIALSGRPLSELQRGGHGAVFPWRVLKLALLPGDRKPLHARIAERFDTMLAAGFLDELRALHARGDLHADLPAI